MNVKISKEELEEAGRKIEEAIRNLEDVQNKKNFSFSACVPLPADGSFSSEEYVAAVLAEMLRPKTQRPATVEERLALLDQLSLAGQIDDKEYKLLKDKILGDGDPS